jgi:hypothetical protein
MQQYGDRFTVFNIAKLEPGLSGDGLLVARPVCAHAGRGLKVVMQVPSRWLSA